MEPRQWNSYKELAWTVPIITPPGSFSEVIENYCRVIKEHAAIPVQSVLHLASGAGTGDYTLKKHFQVSGVDISPEMIELASKLNPEVVYHLGDMRSIELGEVFDAVIIPDSIGYMLTVDDLQKTLHTVLRHLKPGGVLLLSVQTKENFRENNFVFSGSREGVRITVFENNYISAPENNYYEATMLYLIRNNGELEIVTDRHTCGIFHLAVWRRLFADLKLHATEIGLDHVYDDYLLEKGEYSMIVFVARKEDCKEG